jgi:hypothetical protein
MTKSVRIFTMDRPPPGKSRTRPAADCSCSRTRDEELAEGPIFTFTPADGFDYRLEATESGLMQVVAVRKSDVPDVVTTGDRSRAEVELINSRNRSFWGDRDVRPISAPASDIPSWAKQMNDRAREFWAR